MHAWKLAIVFGLSLVFFGCATRKVGPGEYEQGLYASEQLVDQYGRVEDGAVSEYLLYLKDRLSEAIPKRHPAKFQYELIMLDTAKPMAFSPGGGFVLFSRGLLKSLANEAELAFVLSHEIGHQQLGHTAMLLEDQSLLDDKPYQRELELAADEYAIGLMALAGYDPRVCAFALTHSYRALDHIPDDEGYPDLDTRLGAIHELLKGSDWRPPGTVDRRAFQELRISL